MSASSNSKTQSRLEKAAREGSGGGVHYEIEAKATREKIGRLKALRLAKEAADAQAGGPPAALPGKAGKAKAGKKSAKTGA
jgi:hypothetical protein